VLNQPSDDELANGDADEGVVASVALELAEESAWQEISSYLADMPPYDFQQLVADLLDAMRAIGNEKQWQGGTTLGMSPREARGRCWDGAVH
jgi:hypothetical protein